MSKVQPESDLPDLAQMRGGRRLWPERWRWRVSIVLALVLAVVAGLAWFNRERIAGDFIDNAISANGLEASYEIESIGTQRQIITNFVVGDPAQPDFTAKRIIVDLTYTYGPPEAGQIVIVEPRLYGTLKGDVLSFGSLDPLVFAESDEPAGLPSLDIKLIDGRARIASDYGVIGAKIDGEGRLDDGFAGKLAVTAPRLGAEGCKAQSATLYGDLTSADGELGFDGPLRLRDLECEGANVATADLGARLTLARDFGSVEGDIAVSAGALSGAGVSLSQLSGSTDIAWAFDGELSLRHDFAGEGLTTDFGRAASVGTTGTVRSREGFARTEWTARLEGEGLDASGIVRSDAFASARSAGAGTFVDALLGKFESAIARSAKGAVFAGDISVRTTSDSVRAVIPEARLKSAAGETLIALSRISYNSAIDGQPEQLRGNILTGGSDLPQINARLQQSGGSDITFRMTMAQYRAGTNAFAIPRLEARRNSAGQLRFNGLVQVEGAIPGGRLRGLELPVEGNWSNRSGFALGTRCLDAKITGVEAYNFSLAPQTLSVCPIPGEALVSYRDTLRIGAQLSDVQLAGDLGESPARLAAASAVLRYPGAFRLEGVDASIGASDNAVRIAANVVEGIIDGAIEGTFEGGTAALDIVPLDVSDLTGQWSFVDNILTVSEGGFTLTERVDPALGIGARFEPLRGEGGVLTFVDGLIEAAAGLAHPGTGRRITDLTLRHDLGSGEGRADIAVPGIGFDEGFQPDELTTLTTGLIAFADGVIKGRGQVEWSGDDITSSGVFSTDGFDFAAAFGPVRGVKGQIEFTDLLGLTTAPSQVVTIASVNPGIEALGGRVAYSIEGGTLIDLEDGRWPFMGGELILRPVKLDYGGGQGQSYIFELVGLDAASFVAQMELTNLGASGRFDGTIPIVFDAQGNGTIQGGLLISRPPGGNVSYVGELTYEDLGAMANYAFQTLRSLDYNQMSIELNGNLAGEIITNFNIDGVRQGEGASRNFITRQLAQLPIRFKINVRSASFTQLSLVARGYFDPSVFDQEFARESLGIEGLQPFVTGEDRSPQPNSQPNPKPDPLPSEGTTPGEPTRRDEPAVQPVESDD